MALKDKIALGMSLPHRSPDTLAMTTVAAVARRAEELGFRDLWVTENTIDQGTCFDPVVILTYAAAITSRIRVGASVVVLPIHSPLMVAHQWATLDFVSGGRAVLAVGLGRDHHYRDFQIPVAARVTRFREEVELIKALWTEDKVSYHGEMYQVENLSLGSAAGATAPTTALDGRWASQRRPPRGADRRRMDGLRRIEYRGVSEIGADPETGTGEGGPRSGGIPDLEACVHGGG